MRQGTKDTSDFAASAATFISSHHHHMNVSAERTEGGKSNSIFLPSMRRLLLLSPFPASPPPAPPPLPSATGSNKEMIIAGLIVLASSPIFFQELKGTPSSLYYTPFETIIQLHYDCTPPSSSSAVKTLQMILPLTPFPPLRHPPISIEIARLAFLLCSAALAPLLHGG